MPISKTKIRTEVPGAAAARLFGMGLDEDAVCQELRLHPPALHTWLEDENNQGLVLHELISQRGRLCARLLQAAFAGNIHATAKMLAVLDQARDKLLDPPKQQPKRRAKRWSR
jgi:hypothetical protein